MTVRKVSHRPKARGGGITTPGTNKPGKEQPGGADQADQAMKLYKAEQRAKQKPATRRVKGGRIAS